MSYKSQSANMKKLAELLSNDLGHIYGERESGPNGAKRDFLIKGRAFMAALGKDLGLMDPEVRVNKSGIACSGEVYLQGMWTEDTGLYLWLEQDLMMKTCICYRTIRVKPVVENKQRNYSGRKQKGRKQYEHGNNNFITTAFLAVGDYEALLNKLLQMKEYANERKAA